MTATRPRSLVPLERLNAAARGREEPWARVDWDVPLDSSLPFICPSLTPLFYTSAYGSLSTEQRLRYNQLVAASYIEVITFFEESLAATVLTALSRHRRASVTLRETLVFFFTEETQHTALFRKLNRFAAPLLYQTRDDPIVQFPKATRKLIRFAGRHPTMLPFIFWVMVAMEEHSLEISRRYIALAPGAIESHFAAIYRSHMKDEARHIQIDWHLIEDFYAALPRPLRFLNARIFAVITRHFLLAPKHAAARVLSLLAMEFPDLRPRVPALRGELAGLARNLEYQSMMYSPCATPILFKLMDRFPEFRCMRHVLLHYRPSGDPFTEAAETVA